jgi:hypothetical protein
LEFINSSQVRVHEALAGLYEEMGNLKRSREEAELAKLLMTGKIKFTSAEVGDSIGDR